MINRPVTLSARRTGSCRILSLVLDELNLELLGLTAHLDKVDLRAPATAPAAGSASSSAAWPTPT